MIYVLLIAEIPNGKELYEMVTVESAESVEFAKGEARRSMLARAESMQVRPTGSEVWSVKEIINEEENVSIPSV